MPSYLANNRSKKIKTLLNKRSIIFIGLMGSGKSTIGRNLAYKLGLKFIDSDSVIEKKAGTTINNIFQEYGEEYFRDLEASILNELLACSGCAIATGGGAVMNESIQQNIFNKHIVIWLKTDIDTIVKRVQTRNTRPLLADTDPRQILEKLIKIRYPIYKKAHIHINNKHHNRQKITRYIINKLQNYLQKEWKNALSASNSKSDK